MKSFWKQLTQIFKPQNTIAETTADTFHTELKQHVEPHKNRPLYTTLTEDIVNNMPERELLFIVLDNLVIKMGDFSEEENVFAQFTRPQQVTFMIMLLENEVNNGGFDQFYINSSGKYAEQIPQALKEINALKFAALVENANGFNSNKQDLRANNNTDLSNDPFHEMDLKFYSMYESENLETLMIHYIKQNIKSFLD